MDADMTWEDYERLIYSEVEASRKLNLVADVIGRFVDHTRQPNWVGSLAIAKHILRALEERE